MMTIRHLRQGPPAPAVPPPASVPPLDPANRAFRWTPELEAELAARWGKNSAREIAHQLSAPVTRNAVLGKAKRLGLTRLRRVK